MRSTPRFSTLIRASAALTVALAAAACGIGSRANIGPLSLEIPDGWRVTSLGGDNLQLADGTTGSVEATKAGTATVVFDVYTNSSITADAYARNLRRDDVTIKATKRTIDGYEAVVLSYTGRAVAGRQEAVFFGDWRIRLVYRAAFANDAAAFDRGRPAFRGAVDSIRFNGEPTKGA